MAFDRDNLKDVALKTEEAEKEIDRLASNLQIYPTTSSRK